MHSYGSANLRLEVKRHARSDGELWPYLLRGGVPEVLPNAWVLADGMRPKANTVEAYLRDVQLVYEVADRNGFSVGQRIQTFRGFSRAELDAIGTRLSQTAQGGQASRATCERRAESVKRFLSFCFEYYKQIQPLSLLEQFQADRNLAIQCRMISRRLKIEGSKGKGPSPAEELTSSEIDLLDSVMHPTSELNPFRGQFVRFRNYCLFHVMRETALRRGELVLLELDDVSLGGTPTIKIRKPTLAQRCRRRDGASMKTRGREVPISQGLACLLEEYRDYWRLQRVVTVRPSAALFLSAKDGRRLSMSSINKIFDALQAVPVVAQLGKRLHPHGMRATSTTEMRRRITAQGRVSGIELKEALSYIGGWTQESPMVAHYTRAAISEKLANILRGRWRGKEDACNE